jgi:carboxymethylenebutenolidase
MDDQLEKFLQDHKLSRRKFVATVSAGFALAALPLAAQTDQTIKTDANGLEAGDIKIPVKDGELPAYRAMPASKGNHPVVLVVHEIFGLNEHTRDICRRFAKLGHEAIAPDLFHRQGDVSKLPMQQLFQMMGKVDDALVMSDLDTAVAWAAKNHGNTKKLGITGFCWGGRIVWLYAAHNPAVKAGVAWYGPVGASSGNPLQPKGPLDIAPTLKTPILGLSGAKDQMVKPESIERMKEVLKQAGNPSEFVIYPNSGHGFFADFRQGYDQEAAQDGWKRMQDWFKKHGAV